MGKVKKSMPIEKKTSFIKINKTIKKKKNLVRQVFVKKLYHRDYLLFLAQCQAMVDSMVGPFPWLAGVDSQENSKPAYCESFGEGA